MIGSPWRESGKRTHERSLTSIRGLTNPNQSLGAAYIAGYSIECSLKAYLRKQNKKVPRRGRRGHDLQRLWNDCDLQFGDFKGHPDAMTFFLQDRSTDLRYEAEVDLQQSVQQLVEGAGHMSGFLQKQIEYMDRRRRR